MKHIIYLAFTSAYFVHFVLGQAIFDAPNAAETQWNNVRGISGIHPFRSHHPSETRNMGNERNSVLQSGLSEGNMYSFTRSPVFERSPNNPINHRYYPLICNLHPDFCNDKLIDVLSKTSKFTEEIMKIIFDTIENFWKLNTIISQLENISNEDFDIVEFGIATAKDERISDPPHEYYYDKFKKHLGNRESKKERMPFHHNSVKCIDAKRYDNNCNLQYRCGSRNIFDVLQKYGKRKINTNFWSSQEKKYGLVDNTADKKDFVSKNNNLKWSRFPRMHTSSCHKSKLVKHYNSRFTTEKELYAASLEQMKHKLRAPEGELSYWYSGTEHIGNALKLQINEEWPKRREVIKEDHIVHRLTNRKGLQIKETCQCSNLNAPNKCRFFQKQEVETDILPQNINDLSFAASDETHERFLEYQLHYPSAEGGEQTFTEDGFSFVDNQFGTNFDHTENLVESVSEGRSSHGLELLPENSSWNNDGLMLRTVGDAAPSNGEQPSSMHEYTGNMSIYQELTQTQNNPSSVIENVSNQFPVNMTDNQSANYEEIGVQEKVNIGMDLVNGLMQQFRVGNSPVIG